MNVEKRLQKALGKELAEIWIQRYLNPYVEDLIKETNAMLSIMGFVVSKMGHINKDTLEKLYEDLDKEFR